MPKSQNNNLIKVLAEQAAIESSRELITKMLTQLNEDINQLKVEELQLKAAILNDQMPTRSAQETNLPDRATGISAEPGSSSLYNVTHDSTDIGNITSVLSCFSNLKPVHDANINSISAQTLDINSINTQTLDLDVTYKCVFDEQETDSD